MKIYPLIIIGTGPAGYTASIYASRYKIEHVTIGQLAGGTITESHKVCNFPGFPEISGFELGHKMKDHAKRYGATEINKRVEKISLENNNFVVQLEDGQTFYAKNVILATGTKRRRLGIDSENRLLGKGISYCATCDAFFYKDKNVAVIGGGDSATTAALYLSDVAKQVHLFLIEDKLHGEVMWIEQVLERKNITIHYQTKVADFIGDEKLKKIIVKNLNTDKEETYDVDGTFVEIGAVPETSIIEALNVSLTKGGLVEVDNTQQTSIKGLYACGDISSGSSGFAQVITACSEGAVAVYNIFKRL